MSSLPIRERVTPGVRSHAGHPELATSVYYLGPAQRSRTSQKSCEVSYTDTGPVLLKSCRGNASDLYKRILIHHMIPLKGPEAQECFRTE